MYRKLLEFSLTKTNVPITQFINICILFVLGLFFLYYNLTNKGEASLKLLGYLISLIISQI